MTNEKTTARVFAIVLCVSLLLNGALIFTCFRTNRQNRIATERIERIEFELEQRSDELERTFDQQRTTISTIETIVQRSDTTIEATRSTVVDLRKTLQVLENNYNRMRSDLLDLCGSNSVPPEK